MLLEGTLIRDKQKDTLLYAGEAKVLITDWFFFTDQVELEYVGLKEAVIHLNRTDSIWNYQFLIDYFSRPQKTTRKKSNIDLKLKELELDNVAIIQKDAWRGENLSAVVKSLDLYADEFDLEKKTIRIRSFHLNQPSFSIYNYTGNPARKPLPPPEEAEIINNPDSLRWNPSKWNLTITEMTIRSGTFKNDVETEREPYPYFDGQHILFSQIEGDFRNIKFSQDSITAGVSLTARERSGLEVKKLESNMKMHPEAMEFHELDLQTNRSTLGNFFAMRYSSFNDMAYFISRVRLEGKLQQSRINSDDIAFFAPDVKTWKKEIRASGDVRGTVANLNGTNLFIEAGTNTYLNGDISMSGLPDINKTYIDFVARDFRTVYADAIRFVPALKNISQPRLDKIGNFNFRGNFTGFINDFVSYGTFNTGLGVIVTDLNMKIPERGLASYSGTIRTDGFQLGTFIDNNQVGKISLAGSIKGSGLNASTANATIDAKIRLLEIRDYPYKDLEIKGSISKKNFRGEFISNDPNLQASLDGSIDFSNQMPVFNFAAEIQRTNLQQLHFSKENIEFGGKFNVDFTGNNIDNFLGTARVYDASLYRNGTRISFDSLVLDSKLSGNQKMITAISNEFDIALVGEFSIRDLPASIAGFLRQYYPSYIKPNRQVSGKENFSFVITTKNVSDYLNMLVDDISGFNYSSITGSINTRDKLLDLNASIPQAAFRNIVFSNLDLKATGNYDSLSMESNISNVMINDSLHFPDTYIRVSAAQDISNVRVSTSANQALNAADISAEVQTMSNGARITFHESTFDLNGKAWTINKDGELLLTRDMVSADGIRIYNGQQEIEVTTVPSDIGNTHDIRIDLSKLNIGDITSLVMSGTRMEGLMTGTINIVDPFGKMRVEVDAEAEQFRFENDSIGLVQLNGLYNRQSNSIDFSANGENRDFNFQANGLFQLKDSLQDGRMAMDINLRDTKIDVLETYLSGVFSDVTGLASGDLRIEGPLNNLEYLGKVRLRDGALRVKFTNVLYTIPSAEFNFLEDRIDFGTFRIRDTFGNIGEVRNGELFHRGFDDLGFDFTFNTNKLLVLATENNGVDPFFGNVIARANMTLTGPLEDMQMDITGAPADSSNFYLTNKSGRESGQADFVVWKVYGREMEPVEKQEQTNLNISLDILANNYVNMYVIMDELTGDMIRANGHGNLQIRASTNGELTMNGRYDIDRGNYNFSFESFLKKPFRLRENAGNYILWTGDPFNARIEVDAEYEAENVQFTDLGLENFALFTADRNANLRNFRGKVLVVANLSGDLLSPAITFKLELPQGSPLANDPDAQKILDDLRRDENELAKQVAFLIVFNTFAPAKSSSQTNIGGAAFEGLVVGSISGVLSNVISRQFSNVLQDVFNDKSIRVNFNAQLYSGTNYITTLNNNNTYNIDRTNLNLSIVKSYLDDRLSFTFGSAIDFGLTAAQANTVGTLPFLPDITAEWKITPDGKLILSFFYRDSYSYLGGTAGGKQNRTGASISYRKEFDRIRDLFRKRRESLETADNR